VNKQKVGQNKIFDINKTDTVKIAKNALGMFDDRLSSDEKRNIATSAISKIVLNKPKNKLEIYYK